MKRKISSCILLLSIIILSVSAQKKEIEISDNIKVSKLSDNIYHYISYLDTEAWGKVGANGLFLIKDGKALMIDTPWDNDQTERLYNWIKDTLKTTVTTIIPTHWHDDCMGGLACLQAKGVKSYASLKTMKIAKEKGLPIPECGFSNSIKIDFQDIPVECYYLGGGHTEDVIVVWLPAEKLLFAGDISKDIKSTNLGNIAEADLEAWPITLEKVIEKFPDAETVIPGHGDIGGLELIHHTLELLSKL